MPRADLVQEWKPTARNLGACARARMGARGVDLQAPLPRACTDAARRACTDAARRASSDCRVRAGTESHVLRPSPYFQDEYVTANERTATVVNGTVTTGEGFPERRVARILFEELHYNADYQPFKIWVIDAVLDGDPPARSVATDGFPAEYSIDAYQRFMASQKETAEVLKEIARRVHEFKSSYLIVKGFTAHAATKVRAVIDQLVPVQVGARAGARRDRAGAGAGTR